MKTTKNCSELSNGDVIKHQGNLHTVDRISDIGTPDHVSVITKESNEYPKGRIFHFSKTTKKKIYRSAIAKPQHTQGEKKWELSTEPYLRDRIEWLDLFTERYKIYEDGDIKVERVFEPSDHNEFNNFIELVIKNGLVIINFPIGGCVNVQNAIDNAKQTWEAWNTLEQNKKKLELFEEMKSTIFMVEDVLLGLDPQTLKKRVESLLEKLQN